MDKKQPTLEQIEMVLDYLNDNFAHVGESFIKLHNRFKHFVNVRDSEIKYIKESLDREGQKINTEIDLWMNKPAYDPYVGPHQEHGVEDPDFSQISVSEREETDYMDRKIPITQELLKKMGYGDIEPIFDRGFAYDSVRYMVKLKTQLTPGFSIFAQPYELGPEIEVSYVIKERKEDE